jgi:hypothetical protein
VKTAYAHAPAVQQMFNLKYYEKQLY